ncbi:MAG: LPXTG cell wall anchor domain-containing protein, partial [Oscillospiraceae bacterium]|nr:LPXTG cell wall anchor domain-containing protein [Oscillospiraceae bacterium]
SPPLTPTPPSDSPPPETSTPSLTPTPPPPPPSLTPTPFTKFDDDGTPLGEWRWDEDTGEWIFDPYVPLGDLPSTGDSGAPPWMALTVAAVFGAAMVLTRKRNV